MCSNPTLPLLRCKTSLSSDEGGSGMQDAPILQINRSSFRAASCETMSTARENRASNLCAGMVATFALFPTSVRIQFFSMLNAAELSSEMRICTAERAASTRMSLE